MTKRNGQTMIEKTLHRKQHEPHCNAVIYVHEAPMYVPNVDRVVHFIRPEVLHPTVDIL